MGGQISAILWILFFLYRAIAARPAPRTSRIARFNHFTRLVVSFFILYAGLFTSALLTRRFLPEGPGPIGVGLAIQALGLGTAARSLDRKLVYMGMFGAFIGSAIVIGEVRALAAVVIMFLAYARKAMAENETLQEVS